MRFDWVRNQLGASPVEDWKSQVDGARRLYPNGLRLEDESSFFRSIHPPEVERLRFDRGEVALAAAPPGGGGDAEEAGKTFSFQRVPGTTLVLSSQLSLTSSNALLTYFYYLLFAVGAAAPILWFWFRPFWQDLQRLSRVAEQIGSGDFSVQAEPVRSTTVKPFAAAIDQMSSRIGELVDAQTQLTNNVAHELTTPIAKLVFALELLRSLASPSRTAGLLEGMAASVKELKSLVAELLEYARLRHAAPFEPETISLEHLLEQVMESLQALHHTGKNIALEMPPGREWALIRCDVHQMHRAVLNLVRNALLYSCARVVLSGDHRGGHTSIHVDDDGPGIPPADRIRIYQPFARIDASRTRETGGHGLGLAIVQQVAKLHGGVSRVETSQLGGARVTIEW